MQDHSSSEILGWITYMQMQDERDIEKIRFAIIKAFQQPAKKNSSIDEDGEEIIDTTTEEFKESFKGFSNTPIKQQRIIPNKNTEILRG